MYDEFMWTGTGTQYSRQWFEAVELMRTAREKGEDYQLVILDRGLRFMMPVRLCADSKSLLGKGS